MKHPLLQSIACVMSKLLPRTHFVGSPFIFLSYLNATASLNSPCLMCNHDLVKEVHLTNWKLLLCANAFFQLLAFLTLLFLFDNFVLCCLVAGKFSLCRMINATNEPSISLRIRDPSENASPPFLTGNEDSSLSF